MARGAAVKVNPRTTALRRASSCGSLPLMDEAILKELIQSTRLRGGPKKEAPLPLTRDEEPEANDKCPKESTKPTTYQAELDNNNDDDDKSDQEADSQVVRITEDNNEVITAHGVHAVATQNAFREASFESDLPELGAEPVRQGGGTTLLDRTFNKHTLKKLFSLPSIMSTVLEKKKKPPVSSAHGEPSPTSRSGRVVPLLEGRPSSPLALLEDAIPQSPTLRNVRPTWSSTHPAFTRCKFIVWRGGVPGFHVSYNNSGTGLVVNSITGPFAWTEGIRVGDYLESIGGMSVADMDPHAAMGMLRMSDIPTVLRFRASCVVPSERFFVPLHENEKLGVTFASDGNEAIPVVNRITDRNDTLAQSYGLGCGHVLVAINAQDTVAKGLTVAMQMLATVKKPATLEFRKLCTTLLTEPLPVSIVPPTPTSAVTQQRYSTFLSSRGTESSLILDRLSVAATTLDETRGEIFIVWRSGPLGVTFIQCPTTGLPKVNRLTGKGRSAMIDRVQHGYTLLSINGSAVAPQTFDATCALLAVTDKPCLLLFRPPPKQPPQMHAPWLQDRMSSSSVTNATSPKTRIGRCYSRHVLTSQHQEYELLWEQAPLGLVFGTDAPAPYVKRVKKDCTLHIKQRGSIVLDTLVAVNNMATHGMSAVDLATMLRSTSFPVVLRFRRCSANAAVSASANPSHTSQPDNLDCNNNTEQPTHRSGMDTISDASSSDALDDDDDFLGSISEDLDAMSMQKFARSFNVVWHGGDLGLTFEYSGGSAVVKRLRPQGCARRSNMVLVGDALASINGRRIPKGQAFKDTMEQLLKLPKPVIVGFERDEVVTPNHAKLQSSGLIHRPLNYDDDGADHVEDQGAVDDSTEVLDTSTQL
ncbi:hypothetical protein H310_00704 [Aphanomyces invadans]|uniref:PDZ domain-containing protein n=1 Tax=Aphanomyces invadans TaxID=157072 RepID=A0A024UV64_9STRA|nr:hypothetical protein H310_00704 [Aphanomyces invadans]ETW10386.1 hypothetical protein H310_00704 [Aphanomyces invadans]|eukprot:XP_008861797.1 hypothetical protein H310_00704 [Aphanomyces invadans]